MVKKNSHINLTLGILQKLIIVGSLAIFFVFVYKTYAQTLQGAMISLMIKPYYNVKVKGSTLWLQTNMHTEVDGVKVR